MIYYIVDGGRNRLEAHHLSRDCPNIKKSKVIEVERSDFVEICSSCRLSALARKGVRPFAANKPSVVR